MAERPRPRGIRDIAHLYLSRQARATATEPLDLWVVGEQRSCLPGFHVANLAAALAARKVRVRLFELSGVLPNAAFYFCLPPSVYLSDEPAISRGFSPGMNGVPIAFDAKRLTSQPEPRDDVSINVVHMPPLGAGEAFSRLADEFAAVGRVERWGILLGRRATGGAAEALGRWIDGKAVFELGLERAPTPAYARGHLGYITRWESAVAERVPCIARNPHSGLSRAYFSVVESLLARVHAVRRRRIDGSRPELAASESSRR